MILSVLYAFLCCNFAKKFGVFFFLKISLRLHYNALKRVTRLFILRTFPDIILLFYHSLSSSTRRESFISPILKSMISQCLLISQHSKGAMDSILNALRSLIPQNKNEENFTFTLIRLTVIFTFFT